MKSRSILFSFILLLSNLVHAAEKDLYDFMWLDPDKKVYVLQNKIHKKEHSVFINIGAGLGLSSTYQDTIMLHANTGYYFSEELGLELFYTKYNNKDNEAFTNLQKLNGSVPFIRKMNANYGAMIKWSPFYGKVNTFNKIFYFDWSFGAGLSKLNTESNKTTVSTPSIANQYEKESYTGIVGKTEINVHLNKNWHINLGIIMNNYQAPGPTVSGHAGTNKLRNNMDTLLTLGYSF